MSKNDVFVIMNIELVFYDCELALVWGLEEVLRWVDLEDGFSSCLGASGNEKAYRRDLLLDFLALALSLTEGGITLAVEILDCFLPFTF